MILSFGISLLLMGIKFLAYHLTQSQAVLTDALESIINVMASGFAFYSVSLAAQPKDQNHPYGHGKIEFFSAGFEGALIIAAGIFMLVQGIQHLQAPPELQALPVGSGLLAFATLANAVLGYWLVREGKQMGSPTVSADGRHLLVDSLSSVVLLVGLGAILWTGWYWLDQVFTFLLLGVIFYNGYRLVRESVAGLMDEADDTTLQQLRDALQAARRSTWIDVHNMRVQKYGADLHIDCHLTLPYYLDLKTAHDEGKRFEEVLIGASSHRVEVFVHSDPCVYQCCPYCHVKNCAVRKHPQTVDIPWTIENLYRNEKHFSEMDAPVAYVRDDVTR
ncbi:cation diffusion facilitator family transporter [Catalinimonas alkaloidigena]|uniref:Cation diffusion facilitator family transporter n=1 Tax=Catalinimonas alkaloidigena TaxID=1075417 RepID=A0A1G9EIF1_9BACT|nr:cation diffusion facilitator family transporter [Catalinimonas alkaloidigena]SDK75909.1 cation diffusion facilitator family transporter [Catalinimonas alkaloidigena]